MMMVSLTSLTILSIQIIFLLYYQIILGYILSLFLRIGLRIGIVQVVKKKKKNNNNEEEWKIITNFKSLIRYNNISNHSSSLPFLQCYYNKVNNNNDNNDDDIEEEKEEEGYKKMQSQYISVISSIPKCQIGLIGLSPFTNLKGVTKSRTYLLALLLQQIQINVRIQLNVNSMDSMDNSSIEQKHQHHNNLMIGTKLNIDIGLNIHTIKIYLFSKGLIAYLFRPLKYIFKVVTSSNSNDKHQNHNNNSNGHNHHRRKSNINKGGNNKLFMIEILPKLIGGVDIIDVHGSISIKAINVLSTSSSSSSGSIADNYNYKSTIDIQKLCIKLESKNFINETNNNINNNINNESRIFLLSAEMHNLEVDLIDDDRLKDDDDDGGSGGRQQFTSIQRIHLNYSTFSLTLSETLPAHLQLHTSESIEVRASMLVIIHFMKMIFRNILPSVQLIVARKNDTKGTNKSSNNIKQQQKTKRNEHNFSMNTGIKVILFDDRGRSELQNLEQSSLDLSFNISFENHNFALTKERLSLVISNLSLIHLDKDDTPGPFHVSMDRASLLLEQGDDEEGNELFIDVDIISMHCAEVDESEYIIGIGLYVLQKLIAVLPKKKKTKKKPPSNSQPMKCLALSCKSLDLVVHLPCRLNTDCQLGVQTDVKVNELLLSVTPPDGAQNNSDLEAHGEAIVEASEIVASLCFTPHATLPSFDQCIQQITGQEADGSYVSEKNDNRLKYWISGSQFKMFALLPAKGSEEKRESSEEQIYLDMVFSDILIQEEVYSPIATELQSVVAHCSENIHFVLSKSKVLDSNNMLFIVQNIQLQTDTGKLILHWSPVSQWFITSAVIQSFQIITHYVNLFMMDQRVKKNHEKPKIISNVMINTNDTLVQAGAVLGGRSVCDIMAKNLIVNVSKDICDTWDKPDVVCDIGEISANLNDSQFDVIKISSFRFSDTLRWASQEEIDAYSAQRDGNGNKENLVDEVITGSCGTPLLERFELSFGEYTRVDMPPDLDLGKFIEDITQTEKSVKEGLWASGMIKKAPPSRKKYQLMDIYFTIPMIDANFLETTPPNKMSKFPGVKFGNDTQYSTLNRWRFHIKHLSVLIKRNTPPEIVQGTSQRSTSISF